MAVPEVVTRFLDSESVLYSIDHHSACYTAQDLAEEEAITGYRVAKSVVCFADDKPVILVLPAPYQVDLETVRTELGATLVRLAEASEIVDLFPEFASELAPPPLPLWDSTMIHADGSLDAEGDIVFAAGSARDAVRMAAADWIRLSRPSFGNFAASIDQAGPPDLTIDVEVTSFSSSTPL